MTEQLAKESDIQCYQAVLVDTKCQEEQSKTTDSGMEEEIVPSPQDAGESDEEGVIPLKKNKPTHRILDDESDDSASEASQDMPEEQSKNSKQKYCTPEEALDAVMNDSDEDAEDNNEAKEDDNNETEQQQSSQSTDPPSVKKKKVQRPVADDSSDDEENVTLQETVQKKDKVEDYATPEEALEAVMRDSSDDENDGKDHGKYTSAGLFDDENSGNESDVKSSGSERSEGEADADEGFDESTIDPKLLAKLKKGAGKKPAKEKRKSRREQLTDIHSESQRMVRESQVRLPYHQPAPKSINDFLARAKSKQEQYKVVRGFRDRKVKIVEDILAKTRLKSKPKTQEELDKYSDSDEDWQPEEEGEKTLKERLDEKINKVLDTDDNVNQDTSEKTDENIDRNDNIVEAIVDSQEKDMKVSDSAEAAETVKNSEIMDTNEKVDENIGEADVNVGKDLEHNSGKNHDCENDGEDITKEKSSDKDTDSIKTDKEIQNISEKTVTLNKANIEDLSVEGGSQRSQVNSSQTLSAGSKPGKDKQSLLAGMDLGDVKPCLSGQFDDFISFEEVEEVPKNPGVLKLMDRFCKHSALQERKRHKDKDISVISKDKTGINSEELKFQTFTYHVETEEENPLMKLETPGAKLVALKEKLKGSIKQKREQARQIRQEAYDLDNEEGAFAVEEEEAEMSDRSDTDVDEEEGYDEEEEIYNEEEEEGDVEAEEEEEKERNPFADDEAEDSENDDENDDEEEDDVEEDNMNLKLDVSDEEEQDADGEDEEEEEEKDNEPQEEKKKLKNKKSTTDLDKKHTPEFKEPLEKTVPDKPFSMFGGSSIHETQFESAQRSSSLVMPIEDSQDLYGNNTIPDLLQTQAKPTQISQSQDFNFFIEDSQSNMLDADGYLKTKSSVKKPAPQGLDDMSNTQENMSQLLGLCSGNFAATQDSSARDNSSRKSLFDECPASTLGAGEELVGLCSGVFPDERSTQVGNTGRKRKMSASSDSSIEALSDNETKESEKDEDSEVEGGNDSEREEEVDTDQLDSDGEEIPKTFTGFTAKNKHGRILSEFVEQEAELSGSEFDSDENLDLAEEDDIMEVEEGDKDVKNMDQVKLRDEVGRAHFKQMIDEDKRELLRYQEMYLPDGDLYSEGGGRTRRFKWSNMDDGTQQDMFGNGSDEEVENEENENDFEWRKERYEREQFLKEQQEKQKETSENENSQFLKFGKVFLKKQCSVDNSASKKDKISEPVKEADKTEALGSFYKLSKQKRGSFLARSKESLAKIAEKTKPIANPSAGAKSSGKFTFSVISPDKEKENMVSPAGKQRKAHVPKEKAPVTRSQKPAAKKPKLDSQTSFTENSIFNHL